METPRQIPEHFQGMTPEQKLDRLERMARSLYEAIVRDSRDSRKRIAKLKHYWATLSEHDAAKLAAAEKPDDLETNENLRLCTERLNEARHELKRSVQHKPTRPPQQLDELS